MIVVDANVIAYFFINGDRTAKARELHEWDPDWRVPALWRHEYLNVLATLAREGGAPLDAVRELWQRGFEWLGRAEHPVDMAAALELSVANRVSAYDAQYVMLAMQLETICVTEDKRLRNKFPGIAKPMRDLVG